jgi:ABC-type phosphate transport system substrate-binding protein
MRAIAVARFVFLALFALLVLVTPTHVSAEPLPAFVVIVNPQNPYRTLDRTFVADVFLKKTTRWPSGDVIKPVDLPPDSRARARFSEDVLKRSVAAVKSYWNQMIFSGRDVPPPELPTDDDVVKYVLTHSGAIGYVSGDARLGDARIVTVR